MEERQALKSCGMAEDSAERELPRTTPEKQETEFDCMESYFFERMGEKGKSDNKIKARDFLTYLKHMDVSKLTALQKCVGRIISQEERYQENEKAISRIGNRYWYYIQDTHHSLCLEIVKNAEREIGINNISPDGIECWNNFSNFLIESGNFRDLVVRFIATRLVLGNRE